ncbi:hypothetical protein Agub_g4130 [Astrephomene gubernaculifera]|uniref:Uncharacterized protein n=1 Tax=Astrephomene gubernaculifera TaxID=47775 RepID=A0AAD3DJS0_9CHLO|nr:hypothetical protein Agub_g4130 [Astrephomene gubernaculifera]
MVAARAAAECWSAGKPLAAAMAALSVDRAVALVRRLAGLLATAVPPATAGSRSGDGQADSTAVRDKVAALNPRAWAAHAACLLRALPGGPAHRHAALDLLLAARPEWRSWRTWAGAAAAAAQLSGSSSSSDSRALLRPDPSLEYLARLVAAEGAAEVLMLGPAGAAAASEGTRGASECGEGGCDGHGWVILELLCGHHAAERVTAVAVAPMPAEDKEDEEEKAVPEGSKAGEDVAVSFAISGSWRRAVGRAAEALLRHVVHCISAVGDDSEASGRALWDLVDQLAQGCRGPASDSQAVPSAAGRFEENSKADLPNPQAAFLDSLCHVASVMQRAAADAEAAACGGADLLASPLLAQQQHLCHTWLSTCRPDACTSPDCLPPQALLRLLPLVAGPIRRAAVAAASRGSGCGAAISAGAVPGTGSEAEAVVAAAGLPGLSCAWVRHCLAGDAVLVNPSSSAVTALEMAAACFPLPPLRSRKQQQLIPLRRKRLTRASSGWRTQQWCTSGRRWRSSSGQHC